MLAMLINTDALVPVVLVCLAVIVAFVALLEASAILGLRCKSTRPSENWFQYVDRHGGAVGPMRGPFRARRQSIFVNKMLRLRRAYVGKTHFGTSGVSSYTNASGMSSYTDEKCLGNVFFVNSVMGTDSTSYGFSPEAPFASLAFAVTATSNTALTANNDDLILILPGHVEKINGAGTVAIATAGVTVRGVYPAGLKAGDMIGSTRRATMSYTGGATSSFNITAANVTIDNLFFDYGTSSTANLTAGMNISAADVTIVNCEFYLSDVTNTFGAVLGILTTAGANRLKIKRCHFHDNAVAATTVVTTAVLKIVGGDSIRIEDNISISTNTTTLGFIQNVTTATTNMIVARNYIVNKTTSSTVAMTFVASTGTALIVDNRMAVFSGTAPIVGTGVFGTSGNYYTASAGVAAGTLQ